MQPSPLPSSFEHKFVIKREIARGALCTVYSAEHRLTGRDLAIKLLRPELSSDAACKERLLGEARALQAARHCNIVDIVDADEAEDRPYLLLEMLEGRNLQGILAARARLPLADAVAVARQVCDALFRAQARQVVIRNLHPGHVMLTRSAEGTEVVKLIDFSMATAGPTSKGPAQAPAKPQAHADYMAPEATQPGAGDARSDQYSVGAIVFECLSGVSVHSAVHPEKGGNVAEAAASFLRDSRPELPAALADVIGRSLSADPGKRFPDAQAFGLNLMEVAMEGYEPSSLLGLKAASAPSPIAAQFVSKFVPTFPPCSRSDAPPTRQRRKTVRQPYVTPARLVLASGESVDGHSEDISEGGVLLVANRAFKGSGNADVRCALPISGKVARLSVAIRWVRENRDRVAAGLEFLDLPEAAREEITEYIRLMDRKTGPSSPPR
jgi:serine/threonine protein kinase